MKPFFDVCVRCKQTFTNEAAFLEHMKAHTAPVFRKPIEEEAEKVRLSTEINGIPDEDTRLAAARKVSGKRKKLIAAGIESATMTPAEVETRYEEEKKRGTVK